MKFGFFIELEDQGPKGNLYSVRIDGESKSEFQKFVENPEIQREPKFEHLIRQMNGMLDRWGFTANFFRPEGRSSDSVAALSKQSGRLRVYCCRWGESLLILGGGAIKKVRANKEDKILDDHMKAMMYVDRCLQARIRDHEVWFGNCGELIGNLYFPLEEDL